MQTEKLTGVYDRLPTRDSTRRCLFCFAPNVLHRAFTTTPMQDPTNDQYDVVEPAMEAIPETLPETTDPEVASIGEGDSNLYFITAIEDSPARQQRRKVLLRISNKITTAKSWQSRSGPCARSCWICVHFSLPKHASYATHRTIARSSMRPLLQTSEGWWSA